MLRSSKRSLSVSEGVASAALCRLRTLYAKICAAKLPDKWRQNNKNGRIFSRDKRALIPVFQGSISMVLGLYCHGTCGVISMVIFGCHFSPCSFGLSVLFGSSFCFEGAFLAGLLSTLFDASCLGSLFLLKVNEIE